MPAPLPFAIAPDAASYLRDHLANPPQGQEPALITVLAQGEGSGDATRWWFLGEHFKVGYYAVGQRPEAQHIELLGHRVSIIPETLQRLSGRTLKLQRVVERRGWFRKVTRDVLVAG
jgi:hypothetical protein